jgi:hypothetical protein
MLASIRCEIASASHPIETAIVAAAAKTNLRASEPVPEPILPDRQIIVLCLRAKRGTASDNTVRFNKGCSFPSLVKLTQRTAHPGATK